jgi:predicted HTH domain antitoxin
MRTNLIKTNADDLYELVKSYKKISVEDAAKYLKMDPAVVQDLVDFLVEEKIFGIEYKFTTPYIYLSKNKPGEVLGKKEAPEKFVSKDEFFLKAKKKNISFQQISELWKKYIDENLGLIKEEFYKRARMRKVPEKDMLGLWDKYLSYLR